MNIKKIFASVLACCIVCDVMSNVVNIAGNTVITASAVDEEEYTEGTYGDLTYKKYNDYVKISGCDASATIVEIPSVIDGMSVTSIGWSAFRNCSAMTNITYLMV